MSDDVTVTNLVEGPEKLQVSVALAGIFMPGLVAEAEHDDIFVLRFFGEGAQARARGYTSWRRKLAEAERLDPRKPRYP